VSIDSTEAYLGQQQQFVQDCLDGLSADPKRLPSKYFYDGRGSQLFDQICELDEYYVTRTELAIMQSHGAAMAQCIGPGVRLIEYGSGSSVKTRILLDHLEDPVAYVPVDISRDHLLATADRLTNDYPQLEVLPVHADFTRDFALPTPQHKPTHSAVYFPGSTIGNFTPERAHGILARIAPMCGSGGGLLIGIDLQKDVHLLESAYNDAAGVTAAFNLNLLQRINRELDATFNVEQFSHRAVYNLEFQRIEMHLVSQVDQQMELAGHRFQFAAGESICTEYSHKYTIEGFAEQAERVGLVLHHHWTDELKRFAVLHLVVEQTSS
jgi:dimethylhistidine N-methyltransferase